MPVSNAFAVDGKVAIVTGGAAGIGLGISEAFARAGARVLAVGRNPDGGNAVRSLGSDVVYLSADLSEADAADRIVASAVEAFGTADILVNNAAMLANRPLLDTTADYIDAMMQTNIRSVLLLIKAFAMHCRDAGHGGKVVNVGSMEGFVATLAEGMATYSSTKTALRGMTVTLARELAPLGIAVNGVVPGAIVHENLISRSRSHGLPAEQLDAALAAICNRTNARRLGEPADIAHACIFLASEAASYISGQMLIVDGGLTVSGG